jgi:hypothetical protein
MIYLVMIAIAVLMFKLGVLTVIVSVVTFVGEVVGVILSAFALGYLMDKFLGRKGNKSDHTLRKDQWRNL